MIPPEERTPGATLVHGVVGSGCANCGASLASDQRYCIACGARRGRARFTAESVATSATPASAADATPSGPAHRGGATALVAGVGVPLLAMGVGVLIGHNGRSGEAAKAAPPQVITVGGGAAASTAATP